MLVALPLVILGNLRGGEQGSLSLHQEATGLVIPPFEKTAYEVRKLGFLPPPLGLFETGSMLLVMTASISRAISGGFC